MRRLEAARDETTLTEETFLDGVRRDEDVGRLRLKMVVRGAEESKTLFRDFEKAGTSVNCGALRVAHNNCRVLVEGL